MKEAIDNFSSQSDAYKKFRPTYPTEIYDLIISQCIGRDKCWDCATGNGQVAGELSKHFTQVFASDISEKQLRNAVQLPNIEYRVERAESTNFADSTFDLVTVAQAVHWFDIDAFNKEINRVSKNGAMLFIWGYELMKIRPDIDELVELLYSEIVGPFWNAERTIVENRYADLNFDFNEIEAPKDIAIRTDWGLNDLLGYLSSWSAVQNFKQANDGADPLELIESELRKRWANAESVLVEFPIFVRMGRIEKENDNEE